MSIRKFRHIIIAFIILMIILLGVVTFINPPSIFPDASKGFQVMRSMQMGGGFNLLIGPNPDDISKNTAQFLTWWTPGQYFIPYIFKSIFHLNIGQASALTISLFELLGLAGFYFFFKKIGFTDIIATLSLLFIMGQVAFVLPYVYYNGGELLLFGFEGWFLYGCIALQKPGLKQVAFVLLAGWIGFFCKSSFMWIYAAGLLCLWIRLSGRSKLISFIKNGLWIGIPATFSLACIYLFFLSKGDNPAASSADFHFTWQAFCFPLASPLLSGFSVDDLFQGLVNHPQQPYYVIVIVLLISAAISLALIASIIYHVPDKNYRLFVITYYSVSVVFFTVVFLRGLNISYEGRHLRMIGLLIVPGTIYLFRQYKPVWQAVFIVICTGIALTSGLYLVKGYNFNNNISAKGNSGLAEQFIDQQALNYLMQLDRRNKNAVFVFFNAQLGLEILHNRIINLDAPANWSTIDYGDFTYDGHAGPLYILFPAKYKPIPIVLKCFPGYRDFTPINISRHFTLYAAK